MVFQDDSATSQALSLVLLAGGLAGYGVHELVEYSEETGIDLAWPSEYAYVLDVSKDSPLHHKGLVGSIFAVMFGYTVNAEWAKVIVHSTYLATVLPMVVSVYRKMRRRSYGQLEIQRGAMNKVGRKTFDHRHLRGYDKFHPRNSSMLFEYWFEMSIPILTIALIAYGLILVGVIPAL